LFSGKIPRGTIYHRLGESIQYILAALFAPLDRKEDISRFESAFASYCERQYCVAFPFARTAIYFVLKSLNLPKGSEVILPPITIKGILDVVMDLGLVPVYVELDCETINFQLEDLRAKVGPNVKAAIITPLFGLVPNMEEIVRPLRAHGVFVIEDFSQCLNGRFDGKRVGTFGNVGIYSASSIKTLDTLGGGMAVTDDPALYENLQRFRDSLAPAKRAFLIKKAWINLVRNVATSKAVFSTLTFPLLQMIRKINPDLALRQTGDRDRGRLYVLPRIWFCKYTYVQARIGLRHLEGITGTDRMRVANADFVRSTCGRERFPATTGKSENVYWQLVTLVPDSAQAQAFLARLGIDSATSSLELLSALEEYPNKTPLPVAENVYRNGLMLPCFPRLTQRDLDRIASATRKLFAECS
jgi:perosamine synthetase